MSDLNTQVAEIHGHIENMYKNSEVYLQGLPSCAHSSRHYQEARLRALHQVSCVMAIVTGDDTLILGGNCEGEATQ